MSDRISTRSGYRLTDPPVKPKVKVQKRRHPESEDEEEKNFVELEGANALERLEALLERTNNFSTPITQADIRAVNGGKLKFKGKMSKTLKTDQLNMVAQGYDRTATFYDKTPSFIQGEMRDYQIEGLNWMISLQKAGLNGILADEMGLGKTLQSISLLAHNKLVEKTANPSLVIVPLPTLLNWKDEMEKFCPKLRVLVLEGTMEERRNIFNKCDKKRSFDVCICSYETAINITYSLKRIHFNYVVIDEAQRIKNANVRLAKAVRSLRSDRRLLLTGTPFQNNVFELWSLLFYLVPAIFNDSEEFVEYFSSQNLSDEVDLVNRLHRILNPFMLRRVKHDVEKTLLPKKEYKIYMGLTDLQKKWYAKVLAKEIEVMNRDGDRRPKRIGHVLMALREVANHPYLIPAAEPVGPPFVTDETIVTSSGKMMVLDKMLAKFKAEGSRVLIFSQFTMMLDILEDYAIWKDIKYSRFDGQSDNDERFDKVREFNSEGSETFMFLMSTRAGGLGINLATADVVVIYDSDWNPQMDFQAIARAHRIGQKKQVRVFRMITEGTIDDYIVRTNEHKVRLGGVIIQDRQNLMEVEKTKNQLLELLNEAEHSVSTGNLESIGEIDLEKMFKDAEDLAAKEAEAKKQKMAEDNRYLVHEKTDHEIWQFAGENHWIDNNKRYEEKTIEERIRKNPKKVDIADKALTINEYWNKYGLHIDHSHHIWNYRFYPKRYVELCEKQFNYLNGNNQILYLRAEERIVRGEKNSPALTEEEIKELHQLVEERACNWSFNRFSVYIQNFASTDKFNHSKLSKSITCEQEEVEKYSRVLWERIDELPNKPEILKRVVEFEKERESNLRLTEMVGRKIALFENPVTDMTFEYSLLKWDEPFVSLPAEDRFIIMYTHQNGYDKSSLGPLMQALKTQPRSTNWPCQKAGSGVVKKRLTYLTCLIEKELQVKVETENKTGVEHFIKAEVNQ